MKSGIQKQLWLHIAREGGSWTTDEMARVFKMKRQRANVLLQNMTTRAGLLTRSEEDGKVAFRVSGMCRVPLGVTMDELNGIGAAPRRMPVSSVFQLAEAA